VSLVENGASQAVLVVNVGSEARGIKRINDEIKSVSGNFVFISVFLSKFICCLRRLVCYE